MSWLQEYGRELIELQRGNYGQCPGCDRTMTREDIAAQIDAPSEFEATVCLDCKGDVERRLLDGEREETSCLEPRPEY